MSQNTVITIKNDTPFSFTLDDAKSSGIYRWPKTIEPGTQEVPWNYDFQQEWSWQIKFDAWYNLDGTGNNKKIKLHFYADLAQVFSKSVSTDPAGLFAGSSAKSSSWKSVTFEIVGTD